MDESCAGDVNISWDEIWYEDGFYTARSGKYYTLLNGNNVVIGSLTERPQRYVPERWTDYEGEVRFASYYAFLMSRTPKRSPASEGDSWDSVPETLREKVREYMVQNDMKQPETADDL